MVMLEIDTEQIRRAQQGDATVITELYRHYYLSVFHFLYYRVGDRQTAEDLTSEVFLRMLRFIGGFNPPAATFGSWLFQIARNLAIDHFRRNGIRNDVDLEEEMLSQMYEDPHTTVERGLTNETLRKALQKLNDDHRDVIVLRFVAGMQIAEVASALNKSEDAIKGLQRRALAVLRGILTEWEVSYAE
jgi:RNA polymerase sigma-70 factor (ECF subfamily)